jgi:hypothetical protein
MHGAKLCTLAYLFKEPSKPRNFSPFQRLFKCKQQARNYSKLLFLMLKHIESKNHASYKLKQKKHKGLTEECRLCTKISLI